MKQKEATLVGLCVNLSLIATLLDAIPSDLGQGILTQEEFDLLEDLYTKHAELINKLQDRIKIEDEDEDEDKDQP